MNDKFFIESDLLKNFGVVAGFTIINSHTSDNLNFFKENSELSKESFKFLENYLKKSVFSINQCHSSDIFEINEKSGSFELGRNNYDLNLLPAGDGVFTKLRNSIICVYSADCIPILISDKKKNFTMAIHSGWQGSFKGINQNAILMINGLSRNKDDILISVGPSIFQKNYEVDINFMKNFIKKDEKSEEFFLNLDSKIFFDNSGYVESVYKNSGFVNVEKLNIDTYTDRRFYSHRASMDKSSDVNGRFVSFVVL